MIESGTVADSHGDEVVATLRPGDFFGEAAILETTRRTATVTAASDVTVLEMFGADLAVLNASHRRCTLRSSVRWRSVCRENP